MIENNRIEFKRELNSSLEKEVVGFLNYHEGGELYVGISDDGTVNGIDNPDDIQKRIVDRIKNNIRPSTLGLFDVLTIEKESKKIIKVIISSGPEKPYFIKKYGMSPKGCAIRIRTTAQQMPQEMIDTLYSKRTRNSLGLLKAPRQDLTFKQLRIYYEENGFELNNEFINNLELLTEKKEYNYAAYLLSDTNAVSMKVAKYSGENKVDLMENEEFGYCSIIKATENILNKLNLENITQAEVTSSVRKENRFVSPKALREAVINAIIHNDYSNGIPPVFEIFSDRFEITSSGGLPQELTQEEFFEGISAPRNKELMRVFKDLRFVEQLGSGVQRILSEYEKNVFKFSTHFLKVRFPIMNVGKNVGKNDLYEEVVLNKTQKEILRYIENNPHITQKELSNSIDKSLRTIQRNMKELQDLNIIQRVGSSTKGYWKIIKKLEI